MLRMLNITVVHIDAGYETNNLNDLGWAMLQNKQFEQFGTHHYGINKPFKRFRDRLC
jgi:hypothetical protein